MSRTFALQYDAVLFDCDGVLADSEPLTNGVLRDMLEELGWTLSVADCMRMFVGKAVKDEMTIIEHHTGRVVTDAWTEEFKARRNVALTAHVQAIPGVAAAVQQIHAAAGGRIACASGADRFKVEMMLTKLGMIEFFAGRVFSGYEMPRSKPFPDVYLAAASALQVDPARCAVVEDTVTGIRAGVAAGATVFAYSPAHSTHVDAAELRAAGAQHVFADMAQLPGLLGA